MLAFPVPPAMALLPPIAPSRSPGGRAWGGTCERPASVPPQAILGCGPVQNSVRGPVVPVAAADWEAPDAVMAPMQPTGLNLPNLNPILG